ncbi:hypothetical protein EVAR_34695_1 [Eumeta japonica]|uniref:Uncharacterized protein n=1 Tax=Eumeta variegata TaxID=151549 RepID=A0A4C1XEE1_EUMVA|nr:hypothetical protein EVAR_34695_1 [Eumeta japonica]
MEPITAWSSCHEWRRYLLAPLDGLLVSVAVTNGYRIADVEMAISWVLKPQHRTRILFQRIRPWLNAQKRKEDAERKAKEEAEILKREQEALNVRKSENEILVALDVNENELNTNSKQNKSELQNTQDDNTIQENMEKESSNETFKEEKQSKESKCELKNRTEEIKDLVTSELRNITGKNGNLDDNVRNDSCSNSGSASRCACDKEEEGEVFENESSHKVHVIDDKFITKEEKIVKISSNNCGIHVQKPISKNECKNISNRNTIEDDDSKNIEISNLKSKSEKKRNHNSMQQNRNFSSKTNKIVGTKELKVNILSGDVTEKKLQPNDNVLHKNFENQKLPKSPKVSSRSKRDVSKRDDEMMNYLPKDVPLEIIAKPFSV